MGVITSKLHRKHRSSNQLCFKYGGLSHGYVVAGKAVNPAIHHHRFASTPVRKPSQHTMLPWTAQAVSVLGSSRMGSLTSHEYNITEMLGRYVL